MTDHEHPVWELLDRIQMNQRQTAAMMVELRAHVAGLNLRPPVEHRCTEPGCGVTMRGSHSLAEHRYHAHNGPEPEHWRQAEQRTAEPIEAQA